jgi:hypothetical protein
LIRHAISRTGNPLKIKLRPQEINEVSIEKSATHATAARGLRGKHGRGARSLRVPLKSTPDMSADNDHDQLHRERNPRPKSLSTLESQARGADSVENPKREDDNDTQKSDDQGIGEPALAPASERQPDAGRKSLRSPDLRLEIIDGRTRY